MEGAKGDGGPDPGTPGREEPTGLTDKGGRGQQRRGDKDGAQVLGLRLGGQSHH